MIFPQNFSLLIKALKHFFTKNEIYKILKFDIQDIVDGTNPNHIVH